MFFIGELRVIDTRKDDKGNTYHITMNRSFLLSVICEMGIKESVYKDKYYLNHVSVHKNSDMKNSIGVKPFSFEPFSIELLHETARDLLSSHFLAKTDNSQLTDDDKRELAKRFIDEIFTTDQKKIDDKITLII